MDRRDTAGEVGERAHEDREDDDGNEGAAWASPGAAGDEREAGDDERRWEEILTPADPIGRVAGEVVTRQAEQVEVDAERDEHAGDHEDPAPDFVGLAADEGDEALGKGLAGGRLRARGRSST